MNRKETVMNKTKIAIIVLGLWGLFPVGCTDAESVSEPASMATTPVPTNGVCVTGTTRCVVNNYERCVNENWTVEQVCESSCEKDRGCTDGLSSGCDLAAQHIYLISSSGELLQFDPSEDGTVLTRLDINFNRCVSGSERPFSMSVDRTGRAWVLSSSGNIYWIDLETGECTDSNYQQSNTFGLLFGMGFASDQNNPLSEYLYVASSDVSFFGSSEGEALGAIDPETGQLRVIGDIMHTGLELTGTSEGRLFAYSPQQGLVLELNTNQGEELQRWSVPQIVMPQGWAFAHWGGFLYMFVSEGDPLFSSNSNKILRLDPETGQTETLEDNGDYTIVGAGVSTCAPVVIN